MLHGQQMVVNPGDLLDPDNAEDAAIIRQNPTAFHPVIATRAPVVEQATAAPGEVRNVRRQH
jgi:hypothetical protein